MSNDLISAKVISFSISPEGEKLVTLETTSPKFIDAEIEKHRMLSTNSSSSRAIPLNRSIDNEMYIPDDIRINEKGMQGYTNLDGYNKIIFYRHIEELFVNTIEVLQFLQEEFNIHKQHLNRYLEPWTIQRKIWTGNIRWFNYFFNLRTAKDADPNIQELANKMKDAINSAKPKFLNYGEEHLPYTENCITTNVEALRVHSVARCARVSYNNFSGIPSTIQEDKKLYKFLLDSKHLTPFEHQAAAIPLKVNLNQNAKRLFLKTPKGVTHITKDKEYASGNFVGFSQLRQRI